MLLIDSPPFVCNLSFLFFLGSFFPADSLVTGRMAPKLKLASLKKKIGAQAEGKMKVKSVKTAAILEASPDEDTEEEVQLKRRRRQKSQEAHLEGVLPETSLRSGSSKNPLVASSIWGRDFDFNSIMDDSLLFHEVISALEKSDFNKTMSQAVMSYVRDAAVLRFIQHRIISISNDIIAADSLKKRVKELEESVSPSERRSHHCRRPTKLPEGKG